MSMGSRGLLGLGVRQTPASPSLPLASSTLPYSSPPMSTFSTHQPPLLRPFHPLCFHYIPFAHYIRYIPLHSTTDDCQELLNGWLLGWRSGLVVKWNE